MAPADPRVEDEPRAVAPQPHAQLDVLDARPREAPASKPPAASKASRRTAPSPAQKVSAGPARVGVDVVVEQVAEARSEAGRRGLVVVGAEDRGQVGVGGETALDPGERVGMDLDVGVDEDDHVASTARGAGVAQLPPARRPRALVWTIISSGGRSPAASAARQRRASAASRRRDDDREARAEAAVGASGAGIRDT